jgi:hypothetical protein
MRLLRSYTSIAKKSYTSIAKKYKDKLEQAAHVKGFDSVKAMIASQRQEMKNMSGSPQMNNIPHTIVRGKSSLDQILNVEKIKELEASSISKIWNSYLSEKGSLSAAISRDTWAKQVLNLAKYPTFLLSLPQDESFVFYFMEFSKDSIYLTGLNDYKTQGSLAKPMVQLQFYTDLLFEKDLVLMKADLLQSMNMKDAQYLIYQIQFWYYIGGQETLKIIKRFHENPKDFDYKWITEYDYFNKC